MSSEPSLPRGPQRPSPEAAQQPEPRCQIADPDLMTACPAVHTITGLHCEISEGAHVRHRVSEHTLQHNALGADYPCSGIDPKEPGFP